MIIPILLIINIVLSLYRPSVMQSFVIVSLWLLWVLSLLLKTRYDKDLVDIYIPKVNKSDRCGILIAKRKRKLNDRRS